MEHLQRAHKFTVGIYTALGMGGYIHCPKCAWYLMTFGLGQYYTVDLTITGIGR